MAAHSPTAEPVFRYPGFGPFDGEALQREINAEKAALAMRCLAAQVITVIACLASAGLFISVLWNQLSKYEQLLKQCAGV
ncbi:hypothetical protein [Aquamicrobium zhengzhouense]|uniref:Uncharacterized protein n=1 Tax=Aquamicrobium zhengzhouense TaxID=2781738 RepID=A0ABS0SBQ5_9HYPH|nr:hypothetical protein [Aquamicrobium zhengzhouense]MBI1620126.1 hypothetical protein [Aquamicrobium zhengzhouense]